MREIKLRAWDKTGRRMLRIVSMSGRGSGKWEIVGEYTTDTVLEQSNPNIIHHVIEQNKLDPEMYDLMQYTGLKDKNGREIYEGDICKFIILSSEEEHNPLAALTVIIEWRNACWGWRHTHPELVVEEDRDWRPFWDSDDRELWDEKYLTVIGNIYENPELCK
jgi:uncharacterized phage protein (TIGR01671 family)